jgi:hypothetical protein
MKLQPAKNMRDSYEGRLWILSSQKMNRQEFQLDSIHRSEVAATFAAVRRTTDVKSLSSMPKWPNAVWPLRVPFTAV